ncbi:MAG: FHA domain-containing protein, partial [Planctomycetota bacterium]
LSGALLGRVFEFEGEAVVGRVPAADVTLDEGSVSRRHARVSQDPDGAWRVEDIGSSNGTFVGGERVESAALEDGDVFRVGAVELRFRADAPVASGAGGTRAEEAEEAEPRGPDPDRSEDDTAGDDPGEDGDAFELELEFGDDLDEALADAPRPRATPPPGERRRSASNAPRSGQDAPPVEGDRSASPSRRGSSGAKAAREARSRETQAQQTQARRAQARRAQARRAQALGGAVSVPKVSDEDGGRPVLQYARTRSGGTDVGQYGWWGRLVVLLLGLAVFAGALWAAFALTSGGS